MDNLERSITEDDHTFLAQPRGFKFDRIVDVIEFAESKEYLGQKGTLWPSTKDNLWKIFHGPSAGTLYDDDEAPTEVVLGGAAGTGKSSTSWISIGYITHLLGCLHSPHIEFKLMPGSTIFLVFQSVRLDTVTDALYIKLLRAIDASPWFNTYFPRKKDINSSIILPNNVEIRSFTGATDAGLGKDIFSAVITEINFMPTVRGSVRLQHSDKTVFDVGAEMYTVLRNRIETRFSQFGGGFPGKLIIDSARNYVGDFTDKKIDERDRDLKEKGKSSILIIERSLWEAKSEEYKGEATFLVELGTDHMPPRIIHSKALAEDPENVIEVPERHRRAFEDDMEKALRDLAGVPSTKTGRFIPYPEQISLAQTKYVERTGGRTLFKYSDVSLAQVFNNGTEVEWSRLIDETYLNTLILEGGNFAVHVDTSLTGDATGLAIGRIVGSKIVERGHLFNDGKVQEISNVESPVYLIDGVLRIFAMPGEQIDLNIIRDLILELKRHIKITYGTADWMESAAMLQAWASNDIVTGHVSVDRTPDSYFELKHAIKDERIMFPPHEVLDKEMKRLKRFLTSGRIRIDHGVNESKDISDAVAGIVGVLSRCEGELRQVEPMKPDQKPRTNPSTSAASRSRSHRGSIGQSRSIGFRRM